MNLTKKIKGSIIALAGLSLFGLMSCEHEIPLDESQKGSIVEIKYDSKDYEHGGEKVTHKSAFVYLPAGYNAEDKSTTYPILYLMHGVQGNQYEWGMQNKDSTVKNFMDRQIVNKTVVPFIIVTPCGRSSEKYYDCSFDNFNAFYSFGSELRNDLIPFMEANYNVRNDRDGRAMAGLSMGGMQTINIGLCECLDIISWFGAFSAAPTTYEKEQINEIITNEQFNDFEINHFYNICGLQDNTAWSSAAKAAKRLPSICSKLTSGKNFTWVETNGYHDWPIWNKGFQEFAQIIFK